MKQLYVINNNGEYSDWCICFVVADPDEWDGELEELLLLRQSKWTDKATIDIVSTEWQVRGDGRTDSVAEYIDVSDFFVGQHSGKKRKTPYVSVPHRDSAAGRSGEVFYCDPSPYLRKWRKRWIERLLPEWLASDDERTVHYAKYLEIALTEETWER